MENDTNVSQSKGLGGIFKKLTSKKECACCNMKIEEIEDEAEQETTDSQK